MTADDPAEIELTTVLMRAVAARETGRLLAAFKTEYRAEIRAKVLTEAAAEIRAARRLGHLVLVSEEEILDRMADEAAKDTSGGQPNAGESTQPAPALNGRRSRLLAVIHERGGAWTSGRAWHLYKAERIAPSRATARGDLAALHRAGHLTLRDDKGRRSYVLSQKDGAPE